MKHEFDSRTAHLMKKAAIQVKMEKKDAKNGILFFQVVGPSNDPIEGVRVDLNKDTNGSGLTDVQHTGTDGEVNFDPVPIDSYNVEFQHDEYKTRTYQVEADQFDDEV